MKLFDKRVVLIPGKTFPSDFRSGDIYKMHVGPRSHVKSAYYVIIKDIGVNFIVTSIPGEHSIVIKKDTPARQYHIPRMQHMTPTSIYEPKLYNQKNLVVSPNQKD